MRKPPKWTEFHRYPVIAGTALLAIGVTLAWWSKADVSPLFENPMVRRGQLWRLATSMFPHVGLMHLAFNIYWLWVFGALVEEVYGHVRTAALILLFAVGPGALEYGFLTGGVGLSGVGYGLFGLLWVLSRCDQRFQEAIDSRTVGLFILWFFFCLVLTVSNVMPVANIAHGAGLVLGALVGLAITNPERRTLIVSAAAVMVGLGLWTATLGRPRVNLSQYGGYQECRWGYEALTPGHYHEAQRWLAQAVRYRYVQTACWLDLANAEQNLGNSAASLADYRKAAELGDEKAQYYLGTIYVSGDGVPENQQEGVRWYKKAADQGSAEAMNNVAWAYATSTDPAIRNPEAALKYAMEALDATDKDHPNPMFLDTLAEAQYVNGRYEDAIKTEQKAIAMGPLPDEERALIINNLAKYVSASHGRPRVAAAK